MKWTFLLSFFFLQLLEKYSKFPCFHIMSLFGLCNEKIQWHVSSGKVYGNAHFYFLNNPGRAGKAHLRGHSIAEQAGPRHRCRVYTNTWVQGCSLGPSIKLHPGPESTCCENLKKGLGYQNSCWFLSPFWANILWRWIVHWFKECFLLNFLSSQCSFKY